MTVCLFYPGRESFDENYLANSVSNYCLSEIGDIAGVAEATIRFSYKLLLPKAAELFPPDFKFHTPVESLPPAWEPAKTSSKPEPCPIDWIWH